MNKWMRLSPWYMQGFRFCTWPMLHNYSITSALLRRSDPRLTNEVTESQRNWIICSRSDKLGLTCFSISMACCLLHRKCSSGAGLNQILWWDAAFPKADWRENFGSGKIEEQELTAGFVTALTGLFLVVSLWQAPSGWNNLTNWQNYWCGLIVEEHPKRFLIEYKSWVLRIWKSSLSYNLRQDSEVE